MRATIVHESRGRMRLRLRQKNMTIRQADLLETWLKGQPWAKDAVVHERTCCAILTYAGDRARIVHRVLHGSQYALSADDKLKCILIVYFNDQNLGTHRHQYHRAGRGGAM